MKILTQRLFALSVNRTKMFVPPHFFTLCDLQFHKYVTKPPPHPLPEDSYIFNGDIVMWHDEKIFYSNKNFLRRYREQRGN